MSVQSDGQTHSERCFQWGPCHYECALAEIWRLRSPEAREPPECTSAFLSGPQIAGVTIDPNCAVHGAYLAQNQEAAFLEAVSDISERLS